MKENKNNITKKTNIADNPSSKKIIDEMKGFEILESMYRCLPNGEQLFPKAEGIFSDFSKLKEDSLILNLPDEFNDLFSEHGWVAYGSLNINIIKKSIMLYQINGVECAENFLADTYDDECLKWKILRFNGHSLFKKRIRLIELAKEDYLAERYHACIPLLLSLLDGIVNDVSSHVGFFAEAVDLTAWDCIAGHESGLQRLTSILQVGRNKTNEEPISLPYRNGILHGRELQFDNKIVAAKCWSTLFAVHDWANSLNKKEESIEEAKSLKVLLEKTLQIQEETKKLKEAAAEWKPRLNQ